MKKILSITMFVIIILPVVFAEDIYFKQGETVDLLLTCADGDNTKCDSETLCEILITSPSSKIVLNGTNLTNQVNYFNVTIQGSLHNQTGLYNCVVYCLGTIYNGTQSCQYEVNLSGSEREDVTIIGLTLIIFGTILIIIGIMFYWRGKDD